MSPIHLPLQIFELITGDYLFDPQPGTKYDKDDDHMAQIIELLGDVPRSLALGGRYSKELFKKTGELKHIHKLRYWPLTSVLKEKYGMTKDEADLFASFLQPMLHLLGDKRAQARDMVDHPWLGGIVVQGELDQMERRRSESGESSSAESFASSSAGLPALTTLPPPAPAPAPPKPAGPQKKTGFDILKSKTKK